jgi:nucleotide-binding universal stress UspA family protein
MTTHQGKIVCATDFSAGAAAALGWAGRLAAGKGDSIDLVTVVEPRTTSFIELSMDAALVDNALLDAAAERLRALAAQTERELGISVAPHVLRGAVHRAIMTHAESSGGRLVVVGTHGGSAVARWLLGSVAERTVRIATLPVAVVPATVDGGPAASEAALRRGGSPQPLRVLVGLEGGAAGDRTLQLVRDLRRWQSCDVTVLHLYWPIAEYQRLGLQGSRDLFASDPEVVANLEPALRHQLGVLPGQGTVELSIRPAWGDPAANLLVAADEGAYQLLIVGAERRHGLARLTHPSVSERLVRQTVAAVVICVPPAARAAAPAPAPEEGPRFWTVLAPTDLSPAGNAAIPHAYALLAAHGGVVELCHIHQRPLTNPPFDYERPRDRLSPEAVADLERRLHALVPPFAERLGVSTHVSVIEGGAPGEAIVQAAERLGVDAISLGSHGRGRVVRALLGSVAQEVVQNSHKPVLVVPSQRQPS